MAKRSVTSSGLFLFFLFFACCPISGLNAQNAADSADEKLFARYALQEKPVGVATPYYVCISPHKVVGATIVRSISGTVAIVRLQKSDFNTLPAGVRIAPASNEWKLSPPAEKLVSKKTNTIRLIVAGESIDDVKTALHSIKGLAVVSVNEATHSVIAICRASAVQQLLDLEEVTFVDVSATAHEETNIIGYDRSFHGINAVEFLIPGANGKNIVAGVKEQKMDETDPDLWKRVLPSPIAAPTVSYHATVIASIIGGAGNSSYDGRGIAWGCRFFPSTFSNLFADDQAVLSNNKVSVQNHSYGTVIQQHYGLEAVSYDQVTWNDKTFVPVMSSGNQGQSAATEGQYASIPGFANLTGNFKMAKNVITVGAIDNKNNIPALSSAGPLYDGRLAPQLIALGPSGTSDATAIVTGTIAVMQQVYADSNSNTLPPASLVKAVLYNTAEDIHNTGIDYKTGFGIINSYAAVKAIQQKQYDEGAVMQSQEWTKTITVPANAAALKVTLSWTDPAALANNNKAIINDLDLVVTAINSGLQYRPWVLSTYPHKDSLSKTPVRKRDSLNTAEQVSLQLPAAGNYEIKVTGFLVSNAPLPFHIAIRIDTLNTFFFTNPLHASDVAPDKNESLVIKWTTHVADTNQTGDLHISYNDGATWQLVAPAVKLHTRQYSWKIKDTSSTARLRMSTPFGNFQSNRFIISRPLALAVEFNCTDSFRISWKQHVYATAYKLFNLADSPYLKQVLTTTDTFLVLKKADYPSLYFAAMPVLTNGLEAVRSQLINIDLQGVSCFYRALNYVLFDTNRLRLSLELSAMHYIDSVYFERVTASGSLLSSYTGSKVFPSISMYHQDVPDLPGGTSYFRARIKLRNGAVVYSEIVSVTASGKKKLMFYPNPASRRGTLNYVMEQGISSGARILLFDAAGRMVRSVFAGDPLREATLAPGLFIYKLVDENNQLMETGKLILQ